MLAAYSGSSHTYRLGWKGILCAAEPLLYGDSDPSLWIILPILLLLFVPRLFLSYLKVGPAGLELRYWPGYRVQVPWSDIDRLGKCRALGVMRCDALYLQRSSPATEAEVLSRTHGLQLNLLPLRPKTLPERSAVIRQARSSDRDNCVLCPRILCPRALCPPALLRTVAAYWPI